MRRRLAAAGGLALVLALALLLWLRRLDTILVDVLDQADTLELIVTSPQTLTLHPCPPDGRVVVVVRYPDEPGIDWASRAYRYATDRTWRGARIRIETKATVWVSGGITVELVTAQAPGESEDECRKRHEQAVSDAMRVLPQDA